MASTNKGGQLKKQVDHLSLKEQGIQQVIELLHIAEESSYPSIRAAALEIAKERNRYEQKQGARVPPTLILWIIIILGIATFGACWYAFLCQPQIAYQLSAISVLLFILISAIVLTLCGILSQTNLMRIFDSVISYIKTKFSFNHKNSGDTVPEIHAKSDDSISSEK